MRGFWYGTVLLGLLLLPHKAQALVRWECRGITADKIVLTPYQDGSVNLSFNDGGVEATTQFSQRGEVFTAIFKSLDGVADSFYIVIIDTITRTGYELGEVPGKPTPVATKITCWLYQ